MLTLASLLILSAAPDAGVITRLDLARTWEAAQLFHPSVMHRDPGLDEAFVAAVKALDVAKTPEERRAAAALILAPLKDATSRIVVASPPGEGPISDFTDAGVVTVNAARVPDAAEYWGPEGEATLLGSAMRIVIDLRGMRAESPVYWLNLNPPKPVTLPATQTIAHQGFDSRHSGNYFTRLELAPGAVFPANPGEQRRFAFVLEPGDPLPRWALALRETGLAIFVSTSELTDDSALANSVIPLGDDAKAVIRTSEYVGGGGLVATDVRVPKGKDALTVARDALKAGAKAKKSRSASSVAAMREFDLSPITAEMPDREHRMLAALRLWMTARRFWAYPALRQVDADETLLALFTKLETTTTPMDYRDALSAAAGALMPDSHVNVWNKKALAQLAAPPFNIGWVDALPVATKRTDNAGHVKSYDVLIDLDGEPVLERVAARLPFTPGSRIDGRKLRALEEVVLRSPGPHRITVKHADGRLETADVTWSPADMETLDAPAPGAHFKVLPDNIGFIDLVNLEANEVDAAMAAVKDTKALVIDLRGYPRGTAFDLGPRLGAKKESSGVAQMCTPIVRANSPDTDRTCESFTQQLPVWKGPRYTKPIAVLINLDAISQSEHSCLIFEAYGNVTFVGTPTRGTNGTISRVMLPGQISATFTGLEVKHADGRQLQTVGIQPHVLVAPTLAGLRAGKDEVLDKALQTLKTKLKE